MESGDSSMVGDLASMPGMDGEACLLPFVVVASGADAGPVGGACHSLGGEIERKLHILYD